MVISWGFDIQILSSLNEGSGFVFREFMSAVGMLRCISGLGVFSGAAGGIVIVQGTGQAAWTPWEVGMRWELWLRRCSVSVNLWKPCMESDFWLSHPSVWHNQGGAAWSWFCHTCMEKWEMVIASKGKSDGFASLITLGKGLLTQPGNNSEK